jgi:hypothetical protein
MNEYRTQAEGASRVAVAMLLVVAVVAGTLIVWRASSALGSVSSTLDHPRVLDCRLTRDVSGVVVRTGCTP